LKSFPFFQWFEVFQLFEHLYDLNFGINHTETSRLGTHIVTKVAIYNEKVN